MVSFRICLKGMKSSAKSVVIWTVAYEIHHGSFEKHFAPLIEWSQNPAIGVH